MNLNSSLMLMQYIVFFQGINLFYPLRKVAVQRNQVKFFYTFHSGHGLFCKIIHKIFKIEHWIK